MTEYSLRRNRALAVARREEKFRRSVVVMRAKERAAFGDTVGGCARQPRDLISGLRPGAEPALGAACAYVPDPARGPR